MTIYALFRPNRQAEDTSPLEAFPSVERASVALQLRCRKQTSGTFFVHDEGQDTPVPPETEFPDADMTGYMVVWRRRNGDRPAPGDEPEEVWRLRKSGGVIKEKYSEGGRAYTLPQLTPEERRTKALKALATVPPLTAEFIADCDATWRRVLRDLVQDPQAEDAILRVMQVSWTEHQK